MMMRAIMLAGVIAGSASAALADEHGLSLFGELKYPPGFSHFEYVNPDAPKGETLSLVGSTAAYNASFESFDTLNGYILRGDAAQGLHLVFDSLMVRAEDEPDAVYGLLAHRVEVAPDSVTFHLRRTARFHDGSPLTADDVVFSLRLLKEQGHPLIAQNMLQVAQIDAQDAWSVTVHFSPPSDGEPAAVRDLALFIAQLPIFSSAYYTAHDFSASTLKPPLGSGPYRIGEFTPGRFINYERVGDYWAQALPVNRGRWNFDTIRFEYYRDRTVQFEAFTSGEYLFREEFTSRTWATEYNFPDLESGEVVRLILTDSRPSGAQGWFINTRREKFADIRVRRALIHAFDFEWTNRVHFYGLYQRTGSYFENSPMKASGPPPPDERALLEPWRGSLPEEIFTAPPWMPPVSDGSGRDRALLRRADELLNAAGWTVQDGRRVNGDGEVMGVEFLTASPSFERIIAGYVRNLRLLGMEADIRLVDSAQYQERVKRFDFDLVARRFALSPTPGVELRAYWTSPFASLPGSLNLSGIADPAIDALTEQVITAASRGEQETAARALDRVLRAGCYWVPHWFKGTHWLAFRDVFARPDIKPVYGRGVIDTWWRDPERPAP